MTKLEQIRAKIKEKNNRNNNQNFDNSVYPFWNIKTNEKCTLRFLPDRDENNINFWVERAVLKFPFAGIKGGDSKPIIVHVPCIEMYGHGEKCPVLAEVRTWYGTEMEPIAKTYWKKRTYIYQGFVVSSPLEEQNVPDSPIRKFIIGPQLQQIIEAGINDPEMEEIPTDYIDGIDFRLEKGNTGGNASYTTSTFSRKSRPLSSSELNAIDEYGLYNLVDFLPKKPNAEELVIIKEMFEASVNGEQYDPDRWGKYYKPSTSGNYEDSNNETVITIKPSTKSFDVDDSPAQPTESRADSILTQIRNRKAQ